MPLENYLEERFSGVPDMAPHDLFTGDPELIAQAVAAFGDDRPYTAPPVHTREQEILAPAGPVRVRVYMPLTGSARRPSLVWAHGGGFVGGSIEDNEGDLASREIAARGDVVVISVDYHLADGATVVYPQLHQEVAAAVRWAQENAVDLGIVPGAVAVGGASAGGNLAVAACLELHSLGEPLPAALVLAYPLLHRVLPVDGEVAATCAMLPRLARFSPETLDMFWGGYLGGQDVTPLATPEGHSLAVLPPCLLLLARYDDLRSSGQAFAERARAEGMDIRLHVAEGVPHGFLGLTPNSAATDAALQLIAGTVAALA